MTTQLATLNTRVTVRAEEAVAIAQQLIHNTAIDRDVCGPFGPPSLENVYLDDDGVASCAACSSTPAVSEIAILLQRMLPPGSPQVPGGLRYTIARGLLDVDVPPFDSLLDFSDALARFERANRTAVVRALMARARSSAVEPLHRVSVDRRPKPERWRMTTVAAGLAVGFGLVGLGESMHQNTVPPPATAPAPMSLPAPAVAPPAERSMPVRAAAVDHASSAPKPAASRAARPVRPRAEPPRVRKRATNRSMLDRLHLGWLRGAITLKSEPL